MELTGKSRRFYVKFIGAHRKVACSSSRAVIWTYLMRMINIISAIVIISISSINLAQDNDTSDITINKVDTSYTFKRLKQLKATATVSTCFYFAGITGVYTMTPIIASGDMDDESGNPMIAPLIISNIFAQIAVPVTCVQTSLANEMCKGDTLCEQNLPWNLYKAGWISAGVGATIFLVSALLYIETDAELSIAPAIIAIACWGIKDVLWSIACISSIVHLKRFDKSKLISNKLTINPAIDFKGKVGLRLNYNF